MYSVQTYSDLFKQQVIDLVIGIQQKEFNIPISLKDQGDLAAIGDYYFKGNGKFWIAVQDGKVLGSIGLLDIGNSQGVIRKMFVDASYRGKKKAVAQQLYDTLELHCRSNQIYEIYLGTIDILKAAQKFYLKNGFIQVSKELLPLTFPAMTVDDTFFKKSIQS